MSTNNNFSSLKSLMKESYNKNKKKNVAHSEEEASKSPQKFLKKMQNPSIKKLKGIAL